MDTPFFAARFDHCSATILMSNDATDTSYFATRFARSVTTFLRERLLAIPMLNQDLHNIHHLYPYLPFYTYGQIWQKHRDELVQRGTRVLPLVLFGGRMLYLRELAGDEAKKKD